MRLMNNKILDDINNLINSNVEEQTAYKSAADTINNEELKEVFIVYIHKKAEYIDELKRIAKELFGNSKKEFPLQHYSIPMDGGDLSILKKCETLEEKSIRNYESVLNDEMPQNIKETLLKQCNGIKDAQLHMKSLVEKF